MLVECIVGFKDLDCGCYRVVGERFEASPDRVTAINGTKYGRLVSEVSEVPTEASGTPSKPTKGASRAKRPRRTPTGGR